MADRVSVSIVIGGALPTTLADDFAAAIESDGAQLDWDGTPFTWEAMARDAPLALVANEVAWGSFAEIENFCLAHGLAYVRWAGGCAGSFGPERVVASKSGSIETFAVTDDDEVMISLQTIRQLGSIDAVEAYFRRAEFQPPPLTIIEADAPASAGA